MTDKTLGAYERHESPDYADGGVTAALIEKEAEEPNAEVRELRSALAREIARGNALQDELDATESRPLTPDAIEVALHDCMPKAVLDRLSGTQVMRLAEDMHAALTEHPPRPEGAEEIEALVEESLSGDYLSDAQVQDLADFLAGRGVRVVGEDGAA